MTFQDSELPFMPGDDLPKPKEGDTLHLRDMPEVNEGTEKTVIVLYTHDTLAESWDPVGEAAWGQHEVNETVGFRGHWYAIVGDEGETWSVASWEVASIVSDS